MKRTGILILALSFSRRLRDIPAPTGKEVPEHALSPWHGLTEEEINEAASAVVQASSESPLQPISFSEPKKSEALRWSLAPTR